ATVTFTRVAQLNILMARVQTATTSAPTRAQYFSAVNQLPLIYPIPTDPAVAIQYWVLPGSEVVTANHDLTTNSGMDDFLDDLEDIQEGGHRRLQEAVWISLQFLPTGPIWRFSCTRQRHLRLVIHHGVRWA